jgi:hypothetical protein
MRIPKSWVPVLAKAIIEDLLRKETLELNASREQVTQVTGDLILEELMVEDTINDEVRVMLKQYDAEIEKGNLDYRRLFEMTKQKLVKERNIIL